MLFPPFSDLTNFAISVKVLRQRQDLSVAKLHEDHMYYVFVVSCLPELTNIRRRICMFEDCLNN